MPPEDKARQIEATRKLGEMLNSLGNIESDEHRISYAYNAVCDAVIEICRKHQISGKPCFNQTEIECTTEVSFQLFSILDSKIKPPPPPSSALEAVAQEYKALPKLKKLKAIGTLLAAILTVIGLVEGGKKLYDMSFPAYSTVRSPN